MCFCVCLRITENFMRNQPIIQTYLCSQPNTDTSVGLRAGARDGFPRSAARASTSKHSDKDGFVPGKVQHTFPHHVLVYAI